MTKNIDVLIKTYDDNETILKYYIKEKNKSKDEIDIQWYDNKIKSITNNQKRIEKVLNK